MVGTTRNASTVSWRERVLAPASLACGLLLVVTVIAFAIHGFGRLAAGTATTSSSPGTGRVVDLQLR
jgi:hypothetical protein